MTESNDKIRAFAIFGEYEISKLHIICFSTSCLKHVRQQKQNQLKTVQHAYSEVLIEKNGMSIHSLVMLKNTFVQAME